MTNNVLLYFCFFLVFTFNQCSSQTEFDITNNKERIENEYKLKVPDSIADDVWSYLKERYNPQHPFVASITDSSYHTKFSFELFTDQYFDDEARNLQKNKNGIRQRFRKVLSDSSSRKNNRELIQIKLNAIDNNPLNRAEYKFPVNTIPSNSLNMNLFLGVVKKEKRNELVTLLKKHGIDAYILLPAVKLIQNRRRIYISKDTNDFATISLDHVTAELNKNTACFTEIELELNEVVFTKADSTNRLAMEIINKKMKDDLITRFPSIIQDQTPKYNKAYALLINPMLPAQINNSLSPTIKYIIAILILLLLLIGIILVKKYYSKKI